MPMSKFSRKSISKPNKCRITLKTGHGMWADTNWKVSQDKGTIKSKLIAVV